MIVFPPAKINLGLHITEKRTDGYHNIESVFYPIPLFDVLEITKNDSKKVVFTSSGIPIPSDGNPNLVERAWEIVNKDYPIPTVDLHLHKNVPIGAGLGGGSSDAAFCIKGLNEMFELNISNNKLLEMASQLGADCAFFMKNSPTYAEGIGDVFSDINISLEGKFLYLVYPNIHVSTPVAYKHVKPNPPQADIREILINPIDTWQGALKNDFEYSVFSQYDKIGFVKEKLIEHGALYASMSGSGSSVFGIFDSEPKIDISDDVQAWTLKLEK